MNNNSIKNQTERSNVLILLDMDEAHDKFENRTEQSSKSIELKQSWAASENISHVSFKRLQTEKLTSYVVGWYYVIDKNSVVNNVILNEFKVLIDGAIEKVEFYNSGHIGDSKYAEMKVELIEKIINAGKIEIRIINDGVGFDYNEKASQKFKEHLEKFYLGIKDLDEWSMLQLEKSNNPKEDTNKKSSTLGKIFRWFLFLLLVASIVNGFVLKKGAEKSEAKPVSAPVAVKPVKEKVENSSSEPEVQEKKQETTNTESK